MLLSHIPTGSIIVTRYSDMFYKVLSVVNETNKRKGSSKVENIITGLIYEFTHTNENIFILIDDHNKDYYRELFIKEKQWYKEHQ